MCIGGHPPGPLPLADVQAYPGAPLVALEPVDQVVVTTICDNTVDLLLRDHGPARRLPLGGLEGSPVLPAPTLEPGKVVDAPTGEHGFSAHVIVRKGEQTYRVLFDAGLTPTGCAENLRRLGHDPGDLEAIVLSHGHFDHTTGLAGLIRKLGRANLPVILHPDFWQRRRVTFPDRDPFELPSTSRGTLEEAGFDIVEERRPSFLFQRSVLVTGEVDRTSAFESGFPGHEAQRDGGWQPDPLILDDQALVLHVRDRGLVVLTGCGHAGIVNIVRYARRLTGVKDVHAVIGGFHLSGPLFEPRIGPTCDALLELAPNWIVPGHCTGWRAVHALAAVLPDAFLQSSVGTRYEL
jgi:7,8-dihydropterin-6-yl-methyl-4-(beta-D-ribofuranosyl)aminobenzene 5'-phosphate synthase